MSIWDILGITRTTDIALIKSAYARKAKEYHPEEFPEEFQRLQKAYKSAVKYAKQNKNTDVYSKLEHSQLGSLQENNWKSDSLKSNHLETKQIEISSEEANRKTSNNNETNNSENNSKVKNSNETNSSETNSSETNHSETSSNATNNSKWSNDEKNNSENNTVKRDNQKQKEKFFKKEKTKKEQEQKEQSDFNYDEVDLVELKEQFWFEFYNIAENPYLINNVKCWQFFLEQQYYKPLYKQENFVQSFIDNVCFLSGWYFKTIRFFYYWLKKLNKMDEKENLNRRNDTRNQKRKRNLWWKFKCISFWVGWLHLVEICKSAEQKQLHETITNKMKRMGEEDKKLKSEGAVALYLQLYFEYCVKNNYLVHKRYQENNSRRAMVTGMLISLAFFVWISVNANQTMKEKKMEENNQKIYEEKMKNYKKYRKYRNDSTKNQHDTQNEEQSLSIYIPQQKGK